VSETEKLCADVYKMAIFRYYDRIWFAACSTLVSQLTDTCVKLHTPVLLSQHDISRDISGSKTAHGFSQNLYPTIKISDIYFVQIVMKIHDELRDG
jgi:hypothetical protein